MTSSLCIEVYGSGREEEGEQERESKSCKEEEGHVAMMPYHRPTHARIDDVHVYNIWAMGWRTQQISWHRGDRAMHGVIGCVVCMLIVCLNSFQTEINPINSGFRTP